jgi:hypothetical protein
MIARYFQSISLSNFDSTKTHRRALHPTQHLKLRERLGAKQATRIRHVVGSPAEYRFS